MEIFVIVYRSAITGMITGEVLADQHCAVKIGEQYAKVAEGGKVQILKVQPSFEI